MITIADAYSPFSISCVECEFFYKFISYSSHSLFGEWPRMRGMHRHVIYPDWMQAVNYRLRRSSGRKHCCDSLYVWFFSNSSLYGQNSATIVEKRSRFRIKPITFSLNEVRLDSNVVHCGPRGWTTSYSTVYEPNNVLIARIDCRAVETGLVRYPRSTSHSE